MWTIYKKNGECVGFAIFWYLSVSYNQINFVTKITKYYLTTYLPVHLFKNRTNLYLASSYTFCM